MKKHLATFGAMVLGAGIMFWFTHSEVMADSRPEPFVCSDIGTRGHNGSTINFNILHCRTAKLDCGIMPATIASASISCVLR